MRSLHPLLCGLLFSLALSAPAEESSANHIAATFEFDSVFEFFTTFSGTHSFSATHSLSGSVTTYLAIKTLETDLNWNFSLGNFSISPGLGLTFGPTSWTFSADKTQRLARDLTLFLDLNYKDSLFEVKSYSQIWLPIQESWSTAISFAETKVWGALKWNEIGVGPQVAMLFTKEGGTGYDVSHLWFGGHLLARLGNASFHLFLAYDTISKTWLGLPKVAGPYFRSTFVFDF